MLPLFSLSIALWFEISAQFLLLLELKNKDDIRSKLPSLQHFPTAASVLMKRNLRGL